MESWEWLYSMLAKYLPYIDYTILIIINLIKGINKGAT